MRFEAHQIVEANELQVRRGGRNGVMRFVWWREREKVMCFSFKENAIYLTEERAEVTDNVLAELS